MPRKQTKGKTGKEASTGSKLNENGLTPLQQAVADAYLAMPMADRCAAAAYRSARPKATRKTSEAEGSRLLGKPSVKAYLQRMDSEILKRAKEKIGCTQERLLTEMCRLAYYDPADFIGVRGPEDIAELPEDARRAIIGFGWDRRGNFILKLHNKQPSHEQLGRIMKMFTDKLEHGGKVEGPVVLPAELSVEEWRRRHQTP